jgi:N-ethylmaleimide reductase
MKDGSNKRTDMYGGSIVNRCRFCLEILDELIDVFGEGRVGIKLSPICTFNDMSDSNIFGLMDYLITELNRRNIAFVELNEALKISEMDNSSLEKYWENKEKKSFREIYKPRFNGCWISNFHMDFEKGTKLIN